MAVAQSSTPRTFEPRFPDLIAALVCIVAAFTLLWPLLTGHILFGGGRSDMYIAGYSFRLFGAEYFKATGSIPQWNPYLLGGLPYIGAMHGDIFYPTAWLRWIMPVDLAITWGMAVHVMLAGWFTFKLARALRMSWSAGLIAGVSYELTGIVASQMSPGHDGKLFVSALAPLACWLALLAVRDLKTWAWGALSIAVALSVLGHFHMAYFLLIAIGLWTLYLIWFESPSKDTRYRDLAFAAASVVVGVGIASLQVLPFLEYIKFSPRAEGGVNTGLAFATSFAMPPAEIFTLLLPQFNGVLDHYWGQNTIKFHTEYMGLVPLVLAFLAWGDVQKRRLVITLGVGALVFLLLAFGGHSPLYLILYQILPFLNKVRAMGMVFYLTAFPLALLAGIGADRILNGDVKQRTFYIVCGSFLAFAVLGVIGVLQPITEALAGPDRISAAQDNAAELRGGALRLLALGLIGVGALWLTNTRKLSAKAGFAAILVAITVDLWSIDKTFYEFSPRANILFANDPVTTFLAKVKPPYRALEAGNSYGHSVLMAYKVPNALGYHGFELRNYQELGGMSEGWKNILSPNVMDLLAIRFLILNQAAEVPGFHLAAGPTMTGIGNPVVLYERDSLPVYARVMATAGKLPAEQEVDALVNPRFPIERAVTFADTSSVKADTIVQPLPVSPVTATVDQWSPGRMHISLHGTDVKNDHLLVSENWYPDWHATVDGRATPVNRGDHTLLSVELPPGAKQVDLEFSSAAYARGKMVSLVCLIIAIGMICAPALQSRNRRLTAG